MLRSSLATSQVNLVVTQMSLGKILQIFLCLAALLSFSSLEDLISSVGVWYLPGWTGYKLALEKTHISLRAHSLVHYHYRLFGFSLVGLSGVYLQWSILYCYNGRSWNVWVLAMVFLPLDAGHFCCEQSRAVSCRTFPVVDTDPRTQYNIYIYIIMCIYIYNYIIIYVYSWLAYTSIMALLFLWYRLQFIEISILMSNIWLFL